MRAFDDMRPEFDLLGRFMEKYVQISKQPVDFGTGEDLYPSEIHTLAVVCSHGSLGVTDLARATGVTKGAVSQLLSRLEDKGLVSRTQDPDNRSRIIIAPTDKGMAAQAGHMAFHREHDKEFLAFIASLPDEDYRVFQTLCIRLNQWMDTYLE